MKLLVAAAVISMALMGSASAAVVGLFNTGADASQSSNNGTADLHYFTQPGNGQLVTFKDPSYSTEVTTGSDKSLWLSTTANGGLTGDFSITTSFSVTGTGAYHVTGIWGVDNLGTLSLLNTDTNQLTTLSSIPFGFPAFQGNLTAFDFTVGQGSYSLVFDLNNSGGPFALRVGDLQVSAVPEASTWAMMILGFAGVGFMAYRRKSHGTAFRVA